MKKVFLNILAAVAMVSMFASCDKNGPDDKTDDEGEGKQTEEVTDIITIDGDFADWAALKNVASAERGEDYYYPGLLSMKAVADETSVYIYFEYELQEESDESLQVSAPFEIFVNSDGDADTGGYSWIWSEIGYEYMLESEGGFLSGSSVVAMDDDMNLYQFTGPDGVDAWAEGGPYLSQLDVTSFLESAGSVKAGIATVELSFLRSVVNANKAGAMTLGIVAYNGAWGTTGVLPQGATVGEVGMLEITLP